MKSISEKSADTETIEGLIMRLSVGEVLTYDAMTAALGRDVRKHCSSNLQSAKRCCESNGVVLSVVRNQGYRRLDDVGIIASAEGDRRRVARSSKRAVRKLAFVEFEKLTDDEKRKHTVAAAQLGAVAHFATHGSKRRIESKVQDNSGPIPLGDTLKLFTE